MIFAHDAVMRRRTKPRSPEYARSGAFIEELRTARGLSQDEFAKLVGAKSRQVVQHWEAGKAMPRHETMRRVATELDVSVDEIHAGQRLRVSAPALVIARAWDLLPTKGSKEHIAEELHTMLRAPRPREDLTDRLLEPPTYEALQRLKDHEKVLEHLQDMLRNENIPK